MHIFFSYIGGGGISPLALIAKQAGYQVSGSDKKDSSPYIKLLRDRGIEHIGIGVSDQSIREAHERLPVDWYVYSSAVTKEFPDHPELAYCKAHGIKVTKRDELLNMILEEKKLKLIAIAGTHGKTTTTAMVVWLFKQLGLPVSYSVGAKITFGDMGHYDPSSQYFVYECDEFDRNFLAFSPHISLISGISWDHHEIFPTEDEYRQAFRDFIGKSRRTIVWREDHARLGLNQSPDYSILEADSPQIDTITLTGRYNRLDSWLAVNAVHEITGEPLDGLVEIAGRFPGVSRRMEKIVDNLYTDYAHTPEKITGAMSVASEMATAAAQKIVVIYEPLTNRRMHYTKDQHKAIFQGASKLYWVPSYLAREDPNSPVLSPAELIESLDEETKAIAEPAILDMDLKQKIEKHLADGQLVVCLSGGGGGSLDEWLRREFGRSSSSGG